MRFQKAWNAIRSFILAWFFVPTVIILAAVAVLTYTSYSQVTNEKTLDQDRELTYLSAARLRDELSKFTQVLDALARTEDMYSGEPARQKHGLSGARARLSVFDGGVLVLDNLGKVVASEPYREEVIGQDWSNRDYFRQLLGSQTAGFSNILNDGLQAGRVIVMAVPINGPDGEFIGALAGMFRLGPQTVSSFYASIVRLRIGQTGSSYLVDGSGRIIYHTDSTRTGLNLSQDPLIKSVLAGKNGAMRTRGTAGREIVAAYAPVPGTPWGLVTEEDWAALTASTRRYGQVLLVLLGLGMLLPALGVAQLVRQRNREAMSRERIEQELRVARIIQKTLLPKELPQIYGWEIAVHWQPARAVGGDFYDFIPLAEGAVGLVIADVTDKGIPAGLVMASARTILRGVSERLRSPAQILERVNGLLCNDIPHNMFVTCLYAELETESGHLWFANAGQNLPYRKCDGEVSQLVATGMPLGLLPGIRYDEYETVLRPGETVLLFSDGLVEAHSPAYEMFGDQRIEALLKDDRMDRRTGPEVIDTILQELHRFTGPGWEQEDDVTLVVLRRLPVDPIQERKGGHEYPAADPA